MKRRDALALLAASPLLAQAGTMRDISSLQLAKQMGVGWNLGNSLEAIGGETAWGNARTTQALIEAVKAAGFRNIRIPVAWAQYADKQQKIDPKWLARVAEVVGWARQAGLYTIINIHWDGGWMQPKASHQKAVNALLSSFWTQIASHFREHDDGLLFAGTNEVMVEGDWGPPKPEYVAVQNSFNQTFVDAVRATGGKNAVRHLVVQGFNTNIEHTIKHALLPKDSARDRLMMEVHYYDPYHFTLDEKSKLWQWGQGATDAKAKDSWGDEAHADAEFDKMKKQYVDRGVPVLLGEYGVIARTKQEGSERYREAWNRHITSSALNRGLVPVYWDNGVTGEHGMGLFDRASGRIVYPELVKAIVGAGA
jgi:endoglucanase